MVDHARVNVGIVHQPATSDVSPSSLELRLDERHDISCRAEQAWHLTLGAGAVIAIVDTGIDLDHPDLAANVIPWLMMLVQVRAPTSYPFTGRKPPFLCMSQLRDSRMTSSDSTYLLTWTWMLSAASAGTLMICPG